jgi:hypothetical protein
MDQARHRAVAVFAEGVVLLALGDQQFVGGRDHGSPERVLGVVGVEQAGVVGGDGQG